MKYKRTVYNKKCFMVVIGLRCSLGFIWCTCLLNVKIDNLLPWQTLEKCSHILVSIVHFAWLYHSQSHSQHLRKFLLMTCCWSYLYLSRFRFSTQCINIRRCQISIVYDIVYEAHTKTVSYNLVLKRVHGNDDFQPTCSNLAVNLKIKPIWTHFGILIVFPRLY